MSNNTNLINKTIDDHCHHQDSSNEEQGHLLGNNPIRINKPATGDAGVALWLTVMCMTTLLGAALVSKKRKA